MPATLVERFMLGAAIVAHLVLSTAIAIEREAFHDEGVTLDQIAGRLRLPADP